MKFITDSVRLFRDAYATRSDPERLRQLSNAYWRTLLSAMLIGIVGVMLYGSYIFFAVVEELDEPLRAKNATPADTLDKAQLKELLNKFLQRQAAYDAVRPAPPDIADPSR